MFSFACGSNPIAHSLHHHAELPHARLSSFIYHFVVFCAVRRQKNNIPLLLIEIHTSQLRYESAAFSYEQCLST